MSAHIFSRSLLPSFFPICFASKPIWAGLLIFISWSSLSVAEKTKIPAGPDPITKCERWAVPSWGDIVCLYGPGTDASMDTPEALARTIKRWQARGLNGVTLRSDLADYESMISRNHSVQQNPRLQLLLDFVDRVAAKFNVLATAEKISSPLGFKMWVWHPHLYSDGAPGNIGTPGWGRMIPWSYSSQYFLDHPEGITVDRKGNKLWMVREYAYPGARATKVAEFVHMAKTLGVKRFLACMRSEVNQLVDPPEKGDQYGFNQLVVDEMKQKYNVDILTDPRFDAFSPDFKLDDPMVENWRKLRGDHVTQFYRDLRKALDEVDPKIEIACTLSGDYAGPPVGNQRMDWRTWVDEGLIDAIIAPVTFEATYDSDAAKKSYLTNVREGLGVPTFPQMRDYIAQSKHPEVKLISGGATAYFEEPPLPGTNGWRVDVWYEVYTSAWYQRWSQWMNDVEKLGAINFILQNFDAFPTDAAKLPPAGSLGLMNHDPAIQACPGGWYPFGDEASGKALIQDKIRRGEKGNAVRLTSNGAEGPTLTGWHNADVDRSNISARLDTSISSGTCNYSFWIQRESEDSGLITYLEYNGGELDVGVKIEPKTGLISYTAGRGPGGTGTWKPTTGHVSVGEWQRLEIVVDFPKQSYSVRLGEKDAVLLAENIPYSPPLPRKIELNGVNEQFDVPGYKGFNQVLFQPLGPAGSKNYLDDLAVLWKPEQVFAKAKDTKFEDDFEQDPRGADLNGLKAQKSGTWATEPPAPGPFQVISSTSYREGKNSILTSRRGEIRPIPSQPVLAPKDGVVTFDADLFIRSDLPYPYLMPGRTNTSRNEVRLIIEQANGKAVATAAAVKGKWSLLENGKAKESEVLVPYDCWMQVQVTIDLRARTCTLAQQQIGQVAQKLVTASLPEDFSAGQPLSFRINLGPANNLVVLDNVKIATGQPQSTR